MGSPCVRRGVRRTGGGSRLGRKTQKFTTIARLLMASALHSLMDHSDTFCEVASSLCRSTPRRRVALRTRCLLTPPAIPSSHLATMAGSARSFWFLVRLCRSLNPTQRGTSEPTTRPIPNPHLLLGGGSRSLRKSTRAPIVLICTNVYRHPCSSKGTGPARRPLVWRSGLLVSQRSQC